MPLFLVRGWRIDDLRRASQVKTMKRVRLLGGDLEYAVLAKLWQLGTASARDVHRHVGEPVGLVYTTAAKVPDRLHDKGLVTRARKGKPSAIAPRSPARSSNGRVHGLR